VVVDHDRNRLLWAAVGRDEKTLSTFFDELGEGRCAAITLVSADAAGWIAIVVAERCPNATLCLDPFHVCQWASKALDEVRREVWNAARRGGQTAVARDLKDARFALWKNPDDRAPRMRKGVWHVEVDSSFAMSRHRDLPGANCCGQLMRVGVRGASA
jgi:transposase